MEQAPHYYGGQAVLEGVMMRGATSWAVAIRRPNQDIWLEEHPVGDFVHRHPVVRRPMLRGIYALVDSVRIGLKALGIAAEQALTAKEADGAAAGDESEPGPIAMGASILVAGLIFVGLFIVLPSTGVAATNRWALDGALGDGAWFHLVESFVRIGIFLAYIVAISRIGEIHRVFEYHGAEHKTISAWEHGDVLAPATVEPHSKVHVRCGTNFLILVMFLALIVYTMAGVVVTAPEGGIVVTVAYHVALRVVLLPVVAGLAYETLRLGAEKGDWAWVRALMAPGLWLQRITTQQPDPDQLEVAIRAFEAVVPPDVLGDRIQQHTLVSTVVGPPHADAAFGDLAPGEPEEPVPGEMIV